MRTIAIAKLKATLRAELRRVQAGEIVTVLDRRTPVALLVSQALHDVTLFSHDTQINLCARALGLSAALA